MFSYPETNRERDRWIVSHRPVRHEVDPQRPYAFLVERERAESGKIVTIATIFLTNRECPWHCLMCDLWRHTLTETVPAGAIPKQIDFALAQLIQPVAAGFNAPESDGATGGGPPPPATAIRQIKLYNSGSFFDPQAIPLADHPAIAERVGSFERVILECHPALVNDSCLRFRDLLVGQASRSKAISKPPPRLEVAMGLETVHPEVLPRLNKRMTLDLFSRAAEFLRRNEIALRVFILVKPPFLDEAEGLEWAKRSLDFAFACGATVASLIPTRGGNGALEVLAKQGEFSPPKLSTVEAALSYGIALGKGRVFADLWDLEKFSECADCFPGRWARLQRMNLEQFLPPMLRCDLCRGTP
jgi:radical SAM enzyme (TIGR01210 family)